MSSVRRLPGHFIPAPDDVLVDGMGRQWVPSGWPCLLYDDEASVERLARALDELRYEGGLPVKRTPKQHARAIIERLRGMNPVRFGDEHGVGVVFGLFSGGHDSLTSTALAADHPLFRAAVHINTGIGIEATREFVRETCKAQGWPLLEYHPDGKTYDELVLDKGFPGGPKSHNAMYYWLKQRSIARLVREHKGEGRVGLVTGIRLKESARRMNAGISVPVRRNGNAVWINPILTWSAADCLRFIEEQGLPRNPVADLLHRSGECLCGALASTKELAEIGYWYPEVLQRIGTLAEACRAKGLPSVWASRDRLESPSKGQMELCWNCEVPR